MLRLRLLIAHPLLRSAVAYRLILSFSVLLFSSPAFSQSGLMHEIKSAYLFTLVEYFTWQNENNEDFQSPGNQFVIGIAGRDNDIYQSLVNGTRDRQIRNKSIAVRYMDDISNMGDAHLLFVTSPSPYRLADIATSTRRTNTLIVTDNHSDRIHFMINLLLTPDNTITFEVNKQNIVYEKIQMDNDVLLLGGTELDIAELLIATENEMLRSRSILEDTQSRLQTLQASVSNQETQLEQQAQTIAEREAIAEETARILEANRGLLDESDLALRSSQILLQDNSNELIETNTNLQVLRSELAARDSDKLEQARLIAENNELIGLQDSTILDQENRMRSQLAEMSQLDLAVRNYQSWNQIILALLAGLVALTLIVLYVSRQKMRVNKLLASQNVELQQAKMDLQFASDRADAASKAKGRFLANMSHEIRTPMTAILGYSELLQGYGNGEKKQKKYLHAINKNSEHLLMLINEVLDISKIESGKVELHTEVFDLRAMLADINSMFRVQTNAKGLQLKFDIEADTPKYVEADAGKMKQIVINLVGNAVKFTRTGSVSIKIGSGESMQSSIPVPGDIYQLELRVEDTGSGINQSDIAKIFSAFEQSKFGHDHSGTGLGLAISRYHARLMGGDIIVQSEENVGSVFIFRFPIEVCRQPILETKPPRGEVTGLKDSLRQYRILIADDNFENRELLSHFLQPAGFSLKQVVDGEACIDEFKSWRPDLVLLDLSMPKMNGEQALAVIKGLSAIIKSKVVIVTANVFEDQRRSIIKQGADGFLRKPFKKWEILDEVARQLNIEYEFSDAIARSGSARTQLEDRGKASSQNGNSLGETLQDLKQATIILDMDRMRSLIGEIKECDLAFADRLDLLIENFEFERVEELVKSYTPHLLTEEI